MQVVSIISNCTAVVAKIDTVLIGYKEKSTISAIKWVTSGKGEIGGLRMSLEAHRGSLNLALELMSISMSRAIKEDTSGIRSDVVEIVSGVFRWLLGKDELPMEIWTGYRYAGRIAGKSGWRALRFKGCTLGLA